MDPNTFRKTHLCHASGVNLVVQSISCLQVFPQV